MFPNFISSAKKLFGITSENNILKEEENYTPINSSRRLGAGAGRITQETQEDIPVFDPQLETFELETSNHTSNNSSNYNSFNESLNSPYKPNKAFSTSANANTNSNKPNGNNNNNKLNKNRKSSVSTQEKFKSIDFNFVELEDLNKDSLLHVTEQVNPFSIALEVVGLINESIASQYQILPIRKNGNAITFYYSSEVSRSKSTPALTHLSAYTINWEKVDKTYLDELIDLHYHKSLTSDEKSDSVVLAKISEIKQEFDDSQDVTVTFDHSGEISGENNKVKDVLGTILRQAVKRGATDIDFDNNKILLPTGIVKSEFLVRIRVDGLIHTIRKMDMNSTAYDAFPIVAKHLCKKDSTKRNDDTTGIIRATLKFGRRFIPVEVRVQFMPSNDRGIAMSWRIQNKGTLSYGLTNNGLLPFQVELLQRHCIEATKGCTFISGSINRGKNCTLIALLLSLQTYLRESKREKSIVLVENPSEFILDGIRQITVPNTKSYSDIAEAILRFNPDYIAIGEMRGKDGSGEMIVELTNVGHPVFTTVHANSACEVPYRLVNLGIPRFKIVEALNVVTNQVLVRKNCSDCTKILDKIPDIPNFNSYLNQVGIPTNTRFFVSSGTMSDGSICNTCQGTGFKGRTGVFEVLVASENIKEIIFREDFTSFKLLREALKEGFQTLWHNGLRKAALGEIALSELLANIPRPTPEHQGLDIVETMDFNDSQEFSFSFPN
jgi:type IV pilus assembly protein PilB